MSLVKLSLKLDETALELSFVTHHVIISGKNPGEIYKAVAEAYARILAVARESFLSETHSPSYKTLVRTIRIDPLESDERRKR